MIDIRDTLSDIAATTGLAQLPKLLEQIRDRYGLKTLAFLTTSKRRPGLMAEEPFFAATYSSQWIERYRSSHYVEIDPVLDLGPRRLLPIDWADFDVTDPQLRHFFGEAIDHGLGRNGLTIPTHGEAHLKSLFSLTADTTPADWMSARQHLCGQLPIVAAHLHEWVQRMGAGSLSMPRLAPRELECLHWVADGKTVLECSAILGLSLSTARCYLESARLKLNATSNTHAVSIAFRLGLLS